MTYASLKINLALLAALAGSGCNNNSGQDPQQQGSAQDTISLLPQTTTPVPTTRPAISPRETLLAFYRWYGQNAGKVMAIEYVRLDSSGSGEPLYRVDFPATQRYIALLRSSRFLAEEYLMDKAHYFLAGDQHFKENPQNEGAPDNFDFDLVLNSQDFVEKELIDGSALQIGRENVSAGLATIDYTFYGAAMKAKLKQEGSAWKITALENPAF